MARGLCIRANEEARDSVEVELTAFPALALRPCHRVPSAGRGEGTTREAAGPIAPVGRSITAVPRDVRGAPCVGRTSPALIILATPGNGPCPTRSSLAYLPGERLEAPRTMAEDGSGDDACSVLIDGRCGCGCSCCK